MSAEIEKARKALEDYDAGSIKCFGYELAPVLRDLVARAEKLEREMHGYRIRKPDTRITPEQIKYVTDNIGWEIDGPNEKSQILLGNMCDEAISQAVHYRDMAVMLREALKNIVRHQEAVAGTMNCYSSVLAIARRALDKAKDFDK